MPSTFFNIFHLAFHLLYGGLVKVQCPEICMKLRPLHDWLCGGPVFVKGEPVPGSFTWRRIFSETGLGWLQVTAPEPDLRVINSFCPDFTIVVVCGVSIMYSIKGNHGGRSMKYCQSIFQSIFQSNSCMSQSQTFTHRCFCTQTLLHIDAFTHRRFYTQKLLSHRRFYTQRLLHTDAFTQRRFYTKTFTHRGLYTQTLLLHTEAFTHRRFYTQTLLHTDDGYTQTLLHTNTFTHRGFYTHRNFQKAIFNPTIACLNRRLLRTDAFTHRRFYIQTLLHTDHFTQTLLHTDAFTYRPFYTQTLLHTDAFTHRHFYTQTLSHTEAFTKKTLSHTETGPVTSQFYLSFWRSNLISRVRVAIDTSKSQFCLNFWRPTSISCEKVAMDQVKSQFYCSFWRSNLISCVRVAIDTSKSPFYLNFWRPTSISCERFAMGQVKSQFYWPFGRSTVMFVAGAMDFDGFWWILRLQKSERNGRVSWHFGKRWQAWDVWTDLHSTWQVPVQETSPSDMFWGQGADSWEGLHFGASNCQVCSDYFPWQVQNFVWLGLTAS